MTKTAAFFLDPGIFRVDLLSYCTWIREKTGAEKLVAIQSGDFTHTGFPAPKSKYETAREIIAAGADLTVELPAHCTWMTCDGMAFGASALLDKMGCIDEVVLPCTIGDFAFVQQLIRYLFMEPIEYQKAFKALRAQGCSIPAAQTKALEVCIPGAGEFLSHPVNLLSVELGKALKKMYSRIRPFFLNLSEKNEEFHIQYEALTMTQAQSEYLGNALRKKLVSLGENQARTCLNEIYGGFDPSSLRLLELLEEGGTTEQSSFLALAEKLGTAKKTAQDMRSYLLRAILDFRGVDNSICGLYTYVLYIRILGCRETGQNLLQHLQKNAWIPAFLEQNEKNAVENMSCLGEECKERIASFDLKLQELWHQLPKIPVLPAE